MVEIRDAGSMGRGVFAVSHIPADTLLFSEPALRLTIEAFGADRVMFGTDWPPVSVPTSLTLDLVRGLDVPDDVRDGILGGNAVRLLGLAPH